MPLGPDHPLEGAEAHPLRRSGSGREDGPAAYGRLECQGVRGVGGDLGAAHGGDDLVLVDRPDDRVRAQGSDRRELHEVDAIRQGARHKVQAAAKVRRAGVGRPDEPVPLILVK